MFFKLSKKSEPKRILVISLTNIGDVVLTCPVIDILRRDFPRAQMDLVVGPKAVSLFADNPNFCIKVYDKQFSLGQQFAWFADLYKTHYDCVIDLRHTMLPILLMAKYTTPVILKKTFEGHKKERYLNHLRQVYHFDSPSEERHAVLTTDDDHFFEKEIAPALQGKKFVVIAPGAASLDKRWHIQGFAAVADHLSKVYRVVFVGDAKDAEIVHDIQHRMKASSLSLAGKLNLRQVAFVLKKCSWALVHDSGIMHLASYFNVPLVALWGPTNLDAYAPWGLKSVIVRRNEQCPRCRDPKNKEEHQCMSFIEVEDVIKAVGKIQQ